MTASTKDLMPATIQTAIVTGSRLEYRDDNTAILKRGKRVNHVLHLILSLFVPFWFILWLVFGFSGGVVTTHLARSSGGVIQSSAKRDGLPTWVKVLWIVVGTIWALILISVF